MQQKHLFAPQSAVRLGISRPRCFGLLSPVAARQTTTSQTVTTDAWFQSACSLVKGKHDVAPAHGLPHRHHCHNLDRFKQKQGFINDDPHDLTSILLPHIHHFARTSSLRVLALRAEFTQTTISTTSSTATTTTLTTTQGAATSFVVAVALMQTAHPAYAHGGRMTCFVMATIGNRRLFTKSPSLVPGKSMM